MNDNDWPVCPKGTFQRIKDELPSETRSRGMQPMLVGAVLLALLLAVPFGFRLLGGDGEAAVPPPGGIICQDVMPLMQQYHDGDLSAELAEQLTTHLEKCGKCSAYYQAHYLQSTAEHRASSRWATLLLAENSRPRH